MSRQAPPRPAPHRAKAAAEAAPREAYHHGALREALIEASESLLAERGVEGFSLREVARRTGVSPSAPAHHFGDANGLLAAVATHGFQGLAAALRAGNARGGDDPRARLREQGIGYVGFALKHPGRFGLMFRSDLHVDEALQTAAQETYGLLEQAIRDILGLPAGAPLPPEGMHALLIAWSAVHGFAHLALAGQFDEHVAAGRREALLREPLAPMLRQLDALLPPVR